MTNTIESTLSQVYGLIEANDLEQARTILQTLIVTDKDNPDVWWMFAHAVTEPETARLALNSVLHLDPDYPQAQDLLTRLNARLEAEEMLSSEPHLNQEPSFLPPLPAELPGLIPGPQKRLSINPLAGVEGNARETAAPESSNSFFRRPGCILLGGLAAALIIAVFGLSRLTAPNPDITTSDVSGDPTVPVGTQSAQVVGGSPSPESISPGTDLLARFQNFTVRADGIQAEQTSIGETLVISICTVPGVEMRETLRQAMSIWVQQADQISSDGVGVRLVDCAADTVLRNIGVTLDDVTSFATGAVDEEGFQSRWTPIG